MRKTILLLKNAADKRIINYLKEGRNRGYTFDSLRQRLIESGFAEKEKLKGIML